MSSVPEKNVKNYKEAFLLRRSSLQKIKCSANRLQGSLFSKESSIIHHLKSTISSSRSLVQGPLVNFFIPYTQILCVAMAAWVNLITKCGEISISETASKFIISINQSLSKHQSDFEIKTTTRIITAHPPTRVLLVVISHLCLFMIYLQLGFLAYLFILTQLRIGFIFLIVCIAVIHVLVSKISFMGKNIGSSMRVSRRTQSRIPKYQRERIHTTTQIKEKKL